MAGTGIGDLVVILGEGDENPGIRPVGRGAPALLLPLVALPLVEEAVLGGGDELLGRAHIIGIVGLVPAGEGYHGAVVVIVVPQHVQPVAPASRGRTNLICWGSFSPTSRTDRPPAAALAVRDMAARMCSGEASKICWVASN